MTELVYDLWPTSALDSDRWRPVVGDSIQRLLTALEHGRFPQSLILVGPEFLGRELAALTTAAALTCPKGAAVGCQCSSCTRVLGGSHPDVQVIVPQGARQRITIAQVRNIVHEASGRPYEARRRVWILAGVEAASLGAEAANAFLKTLEEPPDHAVFILLAENPTSVLPTIGSRCQKLTLPGVMAIARHFLDDSLPPELAQHVLRGEPIEEFVERSRDALNDALDRKLGPALLLLREVAALDSGFEILTSAALGLAQDCGDPQRSERLIELCADILRCKQRALALNLNAERQLMSCVVKWYEDLY